MALPDCEAFALCRVEEKEEIRSLTDGAAGYRGRAEDRRSRIPVDGKA